MRSIVLLLLCLFVQGATFAQGAITLTTTPPDSLFVCGTDTLRFSVANTGNASLAAIALTLELPSGLEYVAGSVSGATQGNISNIGSPQFALTGLAAGATTDVLVLVRAGCGLVEAINGGQLFFHKLVATSGAIMEQLTSVQYKIETGLLLIQSVNPVNWSGSLPATFQRTIRVRNTRLGRIGNIRFQDCSAPLGISIAINNLTDLDPTDSVFDAQVGSSYIASVGNNDQWLDQNEELVFVEDITIVNCRDTAYQVRSAIKVAWGCDTSFCAIDSVLAFVQVEPATAVSGTLIVQGTVQPFVNNCSETFTWQYVNFTNTGGSTAINSIITLLGSDSIVAIDAKKIEIKQNGVWTPIVANLANPDTVFQCPKPVPLSRAVFVNIGDVAPQKTVELRFAAYACSIDPCANVIDSLPVDYFFRRTCPANSVVSGRSQLRPDPAQSRFSMAEVHNLGDCLNDGDRADLELRVRSPLLKTHQGLLKIKVNIPIGMVLDTVGCVPFLKHSGQKASFITITPSANATSVAEFAFTLPLNIDSLRIGYCMRYACKQGMVCYNQSSFPNSGGTIPTFVDAQGNPINCDFPCALKVTAKAALVENFNSSSDCAFGGCTEYFLIVNDLCNNSTPPPSSCWPAAMAGTYNVYRTNYDCEDQDDNRIADSDQKATGAGVAIRRFIQGDTLRLDLRGAVITPNAAVTEMIFKTFHENLTSDFLVADGDSFLVNVSGLDFCSRENIEYVSGTLIIKRTDGSVTQCPIDLNAITDKHLVEVQVANVAPKQVVEYISTMDHLTVASFIQCSGPLLFGDSAILLLDWQFKQNINPYFTDTTYAPRVMNFRTIPDNPAKQYTYLKPNPPYLCQYSGHLSLATAPASTIRPCENSLQVTPWSWQTTLARSNFFPYEVRPLRQFLDYDFNISPGLNLLSVKLGLLDLDDGTKLTPPYDIPFTQTQTKVDLDLSGMYASKPDEGYKFEVNFSYGPDCEFTEADDNSGEVTYWSKPCFDSLVVNKVRYDVSPGHYSAVPRLKMQLTDTLVNFPGKNGVMNMNLRNLTPQNARNPWVSIETVSGSYSSVQLLQNGNPVTKIGDVFQLPNLGPLANTNLTLNVTKTSCEALILRILFGWNCDPVTNLNADLCNRDTVELEIRSFNPELELDLINQPDVVRMCDTTDWFTVEIYNANLGNAYNLLYTAKLPDGLSFEQGSAQIAYPTGSNFQPLANPQQLPNNQYQWDLEALLTGLNNGLPPVNLAPSNSMTIRFRARTLCGFVANTQPIFTTSARKACGILANTLRKPGNAVKLQGLQQPYQTQINVSPATTAAVNCGGTVTLNTQVVLGGTPGVGDSIFLQIPNGFSYVAGSYQAGQNAPAGPPVTTNGWQLPIPAGLAANATIRFSVQLKYDQPAGCTDVTLAVQTRQSASAFCPAINQNCAVYVASGEALYQIPVVNNDLTINNLSLQLDASGGYTLNGTLQNQANQPSANTPIRVTLDANGNGKPDAGEVLLATITSVNQIPALGSKAFSALLANLSPADLCKIIVHIDPIEACLCAPIVQRLQNLSVQTAPFTSCAVVPVSLGIASTAGHTYNWTPSTGLSCTACPLATFTPPATTQSGDAFTFILTDQTTGCQVQYAYEVSFIGAPMIQANDQTICNGESVTLSVNPLQATNITWSGPGITQSGASQQTVSPTQTSTYIVTATVSAGCVGSDTITIAVLDSIPISQGTAVICEGVALQWQGQNITSSGNYCVALQALNGCDSVTCLNVTILPKQTASTIAICSGGSVAVFDSTVTTPGVYCRNFTNSVGCDSTHCITVQPGQTPQATGLDSVFVQKGDTIQLQGPAGFASYLWTPATGLSCTNCQSPLAAPTDSLSIYVVEVTDQNGCTDTATYRLFVLPPCDPARIQIPNAFTPNGDNENEVFRVPRYEGLETIESIMIFNRWGQAIYESVGTNVAWDGKVDGAAAPVDTYVYRIFVGCPDKPGSERIGEVTLLR
jgi:gliding motility-associated-like protein